ncbi:endonuclease domain-containing protein [Microbacterium alcoholitolerans]|uniref:endonuclease domain-containing protein n=1 Tax=unclassified Microbacterium TaxID=2609290 RepID=UPI003D17FFBB
MRRSQPLPRRLGDRFTTRAAVAAGVSRSRRDARDLARPFHGTRAVRVPVTLRDLIDSYRTIMLAGQTFVGRTAMRLWGLPHPVLWNRSEPLHICVVPHAAPPRGAGVRGRRLSPRRAGRRVFTGAAVVDPVAAVLTSMPDLTFAQLVAAFDALLTDADNYPGIKAPRPLATREQVRQRLEEWGRFKGCATARTAFGLAREHVESPKESETRVLIVQEGLPEPVVQWDVFDGSRLVARVDLAYPDLKIAMEYDGDGHRTDKEQWRTDIRRQRDLEHLGWIVLHLTESDLEDPAAFIAQLRRALAIRQSSVA